ncbi:MAG TPA: HIT domain-containing protein [Anaeromyxobacter sp.]
MTSGPAGCLFCRIVSGSVPAHVVHEAPGAIAFLDVHPAARGHVLVVPRVHAETLLDLDGPAIGDLFLAVKDVQVKLRAALRPLGFNVGWNHGRSAGQHVLHLHVHVLPRYADGGRGVQLLGSGGDRDEVETIAAAIRGASGS